MAPGWATAPGWERVHPRQERFHPGQERFHPEVPYRRRAGAASAR